MPLQRALPLSHILCFDRHRFAVFKREDFEDFDPDNHRKHPTPSQVALNQNYIHLVTLRGKISILNTGKYCSQGF